MQFVTSCYGQAFAPFLAVLLRSLRLTNPDAKVLILYDDISRKTIAALARANPSATFVAEGGTSDVQDKIKRIGAKTTFWLRGMEMTEADQVVFLDCDMIVRSRIDNALPADADMLVTVKPEQIPINTGFVIVRRNERTLAFMTEWDRFTQDVARAKTDYSISGGPGQHALLQMMGTMRPEPGCMTVHGIKIHLAPCSVYNETNSVPISAPAKVLHYKGPWHGMLIRGKRYSRHRPRDTSMAMRQIWRSYLLAEEHELGMPLLPLVPRIKSLARDWYDAATAYVSGRLIEHNPHGERDAVARGEVDHVEITVDPHVAVGGRIEHADLGDRPAPRCRDRAHDLIRVIGRVRCLLARGALGAALVGIAGIRNIVVRSILA